MELLRDLEESLFVYIVRQDPTQTDELLHAEHQTTDSEGLQHNKSDVISAMQHESPPKHSFWTQAFTYTRLSEEEVQLRYQFANLRESNRLFNHTVRTSVWCKADGRWQQRSHIVELSPPFDKSDS